MLDLLFRGLFFSPDGAPDGASSEDPEPEGATKPDAEGKKKDTKEEPEPEKTFTQAEMNAIISDRLKREREKYADYDEAKKKAERLDKLEEEAKTEEQKAIEEADKAKKAAEQRVSEANQRLIRAEILTKAKDLGFTHPEDAFKLMDRSEVAIDENTLEVSGVDESLEALKKARPGMIGKTKQPEVGPTNPDQGAPEETDAERRARIYGSGGNSLLSAKGAAAHGGGVLFNPQLNPKQEKPE